MEAIDALVLAKLAASDEPHDLRAIADGLHMSPTELKRSLRRLDDAGVYYESLGISPERTLDFFERALKYMIPPRMRGGIVRGVPTSSYVPWLDALFTPSDTPLVWPDEAGEERGRPLEPIHPDVTELARDDRALHLVLACADCFRAGDARERAVARRVLNALLKRDGARQRQRIA